VGEFTKNSGQTRSNTLKRVRGDTLREGDTRVKSIKVTVMSKKKSCFQEKISRDDTEELTDRQTVMTKKGRREK